MKRLCGCCICLSAFLVVSGCQHAAEVEVHSRVLELLVDAHVPLAEGCHALNQLDAPPQRGQLATAPSFSPRAWSFEQWGLLSASVDRVIILRIDKNGGVSEVTASESFDSEALVLLRSILRGVEFGRGEKDGIPVEYCIPMRINILERTV